MELEKFNKEEALEQFKLGDVNAFLKYDLRGVDLSGEDLSCVNLSEKDLCMAKLIGANLEGANLEGANLEGAKLKGANLEGANLIGANLEGANLEGAKLYGADLDFSCLPLWCGGLGWKIDKRIACQIAYHLCSMECDDPEFIEIYNKIYEFANQFHRAEECGFLEKR